jgi:hypothetical protein
MMANPALGARRSSPCQSRLRTFHRGRVARGAGIDGMTVGLDRTVLAFHYASSERPGGASKPATGRREARVLRSRLRRLFP